MEMVNGIRGTTLELYYKRRRRIMESWITRDQLYEEFQCSREVEFSLHDIKLFAEPNVDWEREGKYGIWDASRHVIIISGSIGQVFAYKFLGRFSLNENFEEFDIEYVL